VLLCALVLGVLRAEFFSVRVENETVLFYTGAQALVEGAVHGDPEKREESLYTIVRVEKINGESARGSLLVFFPRDTLLFHKDFVRLRGMLREPEVFATEGGRAFNYPGYLRVRGVGALVYDARLLEKRDGGFSVFSVLFSLKHKLQESARRIFTEPSASLLEGLLIGGRQGFSEHITDAFIVSGLIHVVALSGYNISIVAEAILRVLSFAPAPIQFSFGSVAIFLFALMTGGGATALRAAIMGVIAILARYVNRPAAALRALALAVLLMVLWNPALLLFDRSFQLSVLATFGLITLSPAVEKFLFRLSPSFFVHHGGVLSLAASTLSVQMFLLPALLYMSGVLSLVAFPANMLALPAVPLAMLFGFAAVVAHAIHPALSLLPALPGSILLQWITGVAHIAAALPGSALIIETFPVWIAFGVYVPLIVLALFLYNRYTPSRVKKKGSAGAGKKS